MLKRFLLIGSLSIFMAGCSSFFGSQPPAPIYGSGAKVYSKPLPKVAKSKSKAKPKVAKQIEPPAITQEIPEVLTTKPFVEPEQVAVPAVDVPIEPLIPIQQEPVAVPSKQEPTLPEQVANVPPPANRAERSVEDVAMPTLKQEPIESPPDSPMQQTKFSPLDSFAPLSPAVNALASAANQSSKSGDIEAATTTIERAIRIEPRNATLYYKLAVLRLKQSKPKLAEDLAKKALLLATNDTSLKKHSWLLVARAKELLGDISGSREARAQADKF
jgi:PBP1b-binding outer membrane lipoprotein LpoB